MTRALNIVLLAITVVVLLVAIGGAVLLATFNPNDYREQIRAAAEEMTGCRITLHDNLEVTFLPRPGLKTGRISVHSPATPAEKPVLAAENITLFLAPESLLDRVLELQEVIVHGARVVYIDAPERGTFFWCGKKPDPAPPATGPGRLRFVSNTERITCFDTLVTASDLKENELWSVRLDKAELTEPHSDANASLKMSGAVLKGANASAFSLDALLNLDSRGMLGARITSLNLRLEGIGDLPLLLEGQGSLLYDKEAGRMELDKLWGTLQVAGARDTTPGADAGGRSEFRGHLTVALAKGEKPRAVGGALHVGQMDLDMLLHGLDPSVGFAETDEESIKGAPNFTRPKVSRIVSHGSTGALPQQGGGQAPEAGLPEDAVPRPASSPWQSFLAADTSFDLVLSADTVVTGSLPLHKLQVKIRSLEKQAAVPFSFEFFGGGVTGTGRADFSRKPPTFAVIAQAKGVNVARLLEGWGANYEMSGVGSATLELSGQGRVYTDFVHSLKGNAAFQVLNGQIRRFSLIPDDLPHHIAAPASFLFRRLSAGASIHAGTATVNTILLESPEMSATGGGSVYLPYRQLDLGVDFRINDKPPAIPVSISGPYGALSCTVDMQRFMRNVDEAYAHDVPYTDSPRQGTGEIYIDPDGMLRSR